MNLLLLLALLLGLAAPDCAGARPTPGPVPGPRAAGLPAWQPPAPRPAAAAPSAVPDSIIVRYREGVDAGGRAASRALLAGGLRRFYGGLNAEAIALPAGTDLEAALAAARRDPRVLVAQPNHRYRLAAIPDDPLFGELWGLHNNGFRAGYEDADVDAPAAWDLATGGDAVVAVIDTGTALDHEDLAANLWTNPGEIPGNGVDDDANGWVDDVHGYDTVNGDPDPSDTIGHGTHVAGTIGAVGGNGIGVAGVSWRVRIMTLQIFAKDGEFINATDEGVLEALEYVRVMRERGVPVVATNNSWGGDGFSPVLLAAIEAQAQAGILFVAAAGNASEDNDARPFYPASYAAPNVISVAATDASDALALFSHHGRRTVDLGAPGTGILSTMSFDNLWDPGGGNRYLSLNGTSMAAPHVTGLAALLAARHPGRDWRALKNLVLAGAEPIPALAGATVTGGRMNAAASLGCSRRRVFSVLQAPAKAVPGAAAVVSVLSIECAAPLGPVVGVTRSGQRIALRDNGVAPDAAAGDGIFSAWWRPGLPTPWIEFSSPAGRERVGFGLRQLPVSLPDAYAGTAYHQRFVVAGGVPRHRWRLAGGSLPPGLEIDSPSGSLSGFAATPGAYRFSLEVRDETGARAVAAHALRVVPRLAVSTRLLADGSPGAPYRTRLEASGGRRPHRWEIPEGALPPGLALEPASGVISGVPTAPGVFRFTAVVRDGGTAPSQPMAARRLQIVVDAALVAVRRDLFDGGEADASSGIAVGPSGRVFTAGTTQRGVRYDDFFLAAVDLPWGTAWERVIDGPGSGWDGAAAVAVDAAGDVIAVGKQEPAEGSVQIHTVKLAADGVERWSRLWPESAVGYCEGRAVAVGPAGEVVAGGSDLADFVVVKYAADGTLLWDRRFDGGEAEDLLGVAVDGDGNVYAVGRGPVGGVGDVLVAAWSADGTFLRSWRYGAAGEAQGEDIAVLPDGGLAVAGFADRALLVVVFETDGTVRWSSGRADPVPGREEFAHGVACDGAGRVYVSGQSFNGTDFDWITLRYDAEGREEWYKRVDHAADSWRADYAKDVALAPSGDLLVCGAIQDNGAAGFSTDALVERYAAAPALDEDGDGVPAAADCDDRDAGVNPAAEEVARDGVDQDCSRADNSIQILGAVWGWRDRRLVVRAASLAGPAAGLVLEEFGLPLAWDAALGEWRGTVGPLAASPGRVTVVGREGRSTAPVRVLY